MKSLSLLATALAVGSVAALPADHPLFARAISRMEKRQGMTTLVNNMFNPKGGKVVAVAGATPARQEIQGSPKVEGASPKRIKMRYGPYKVPNMKVTNILGEEGALWNYADPVADKPCGESGECTIIGMYAGLEYPDGKNANIDTGLWLHHMVLFNIGPGRSDATCKSSIASLPHMIVGSSASSSERLFSSGNERTPAIVPEWTTGKDVGYKLKKTDKFALIVDLMNENMADSTVYLTITYDILTPAESEKYDDMKPVWFDVAQCLTSEWPPPYNEGNYTVPAATWVANFDGEIIGAAGHLHDGGQRVTLSVDGKQVCNSEATYGGSAEYTQKTSMHKNSALEHISKMSLCTNDNFTQKELRRGQKWKLRAEYDYTKNKGVLHGDGKQSTVMGIAIMYVRIKK